MKIAELEVGKSYTIPLVVTAAVERKTKANKPYLSLTFYDGTDTISGNYWDWAGKNTPEKNAILDVTAQVTEWQGAAQLNIRCMVHNADRHISEFMPSSGQDIATVYKDAYIMAGDIHDDFFRSLCLSVLDELQSLWITVPAAKSIHHAYIAGTLIHSLSVARLAMAIAKETPGADVALATTGGFLHDIGKLFGYRIDGIVCEMTEEGMLYDHLFIGAELIGNYADSAGLLHTHRDVDKLEMLRHIILSHHGVREYGAVVTPASIEAHIVYHADTIDAIAEQVRDASKKVETKWTDRIWALDNKPHLSIGYVQAVMSSEP